MSPSSVSCPVTGVTWKENRTMKATQAIVTGVAMLVVTVAAHAQATPPKTDKVAGAPKVETVTMTALVRY